VPQAPPSVRIEAQTVAPVSGLHLDARLLAMVGRDYVWVSGSWVRPPRTTAVWVPGHWVSRGAGWIWVPGHGDKRPVVCKSDLHRVVRSTFLRRDV